jgi:flagellar basal body rod protein FlgC
MDESTKNFLNSIIVCKNYNAKIIDKNGYWIIENASEEMLVDILIIIRLKLDISANNIANVNTTRTFEGGPFIRQYLKITPGNGIEIAKDTSALTRFVWDPTHPDAIKTGAKEGYVELPNVDVVTEKVALEAYGRLYSAIAEYLKENYNVYVL